MASFPDIFIRDWTFYRGCDNSRNLLNRVALQPHKSTGFAWHDENGWFPVSELHWVHQEVAYRYQVIAKEAAMTTCKVIPFRKPPMHPKRHIFARILKKFGLSRPQKVARNTVIYIRGFGPGAMTVGSRDHR